MKRIKLSQNKHALVDDEDFKSLSKFKWYACKIGKTHYAGRNSYTKKDRTVVYMHRQILKTPRSFDTDHINGNGLDNRKSNLRVATRSQNMSNRTRLFKNNTSGFTGISWNKERRKWFVYIKRNYKMKSLGLFRNKKMAILARRTAEMESK